MRKHPEQEEAAGRKGGRGNDAEASGTGGSIRNRRKQRDGRAAAGTEGRQREQKGGSGNDAVASGTGGSSGTEGRQREGCGSIGNRRKQRERKGGIGNGRAASGTEGRHREQGVMRMGIRCSGLGLELGGGGEVAGGGRLVDGKVEAGYDGVEVVEDVGLKLLEGLPACAGGEEV